MSIIVILIQVELLPGVFFKRLSELFLCPQIDRADIIDVP